MKFSPFSVSFRVFYILPSWISSSTYWKLASWPWMLVWEHRFHRSLFEILGHFHIQTCYQREPNHWQYKAKKKQFPHKQKREYSHTHTHTYQLNMSANTPTPQYLHRESTTICVFTWYHGLLLITPTYVQLHWHLKKHAFAYQRVVQ